MQLKQLKYLLILLLAIPFKLTATYTQPQKIDTAEIGFYVDDIYDINYVKGTYKVNLFVWVTSTSVNYNFEEYLDIHHSIDKKIELIMMDSTNYINGRKVYWSEVRLNVEVLQKFDISRFPFDHQAVNLGLEFAYSDPKYFIINLSTKNSIIPKTIPKDWQILSTKHFLEPYHYDTNFGAPGVSTFNFNVLHISLLK